VSLNSESINMTENEMNILANKIADIIFERQEQYDAQFQIDMQNIVKKDYEYTFYYNDKRVSDEDRLIELEKMMKHSIDTEDYLKASELKTKIQELKDKLNKK
jgi:hypothetical protein